MKQKSQDYLKENIANAEEIRKKIHEETDYETKEILSRAKTMAANILNDAREQAEKDKADGLLILEKKINTIKERIFSALNLEKKRVIMGEKSKFIEEVFIELGNCASAFRREQEYPPFLKRVILEATDVIDAKSLEVLYSPFDEKIINDAFADDAKKL
ncbi:MAG: V-type ATP synthase subunit E family protein, partial [Candidatus Omnitrophica bacterium]|nr:V-type ATP synthase subunit E family protein [Candidatus Omnitrophota bacterium]